MTQQEMVTKFNQLVQDETFAQDFFSSETPETARTMLADHGIDMTVEEVTALGKMFADNPSGELSEEQLGDVAGGGFIAVFAGAAAIYAGATAAAKAGNWLGTKVIGPAIVKWKIKW